MYICYLLVLLCLFLTISKVPLLVLKNIMLTYVFEGRLHCFCLECEACVRSLQCTVRGQARMVHVPGRGCFVSVVLGYVC